MTDEHIEIIKILLVEDEVGHAELIKRAFETRTPYPQIHTCLGLREAQAFLQSTLPDLIMADLRLPDGAGTALLPVSPEEALYPVIIMTSQGDEQVAVEAIKAGAMDYVVKTDLSLAQMPYIAERSLREWRHIQQRKAAERAVQEAQANLLLQQQHEKERIEQELKKVKDSLILKTRLATIGQVTASIAHELRNPLGAVRNATFYLKRRAYADAKCMTYLDIIEKEVSRANQIINDLLQMSRSRPPSRQQVSLYVLLQQAFVRVEGMEQITLQSNFDTATCKVFVDCGQFEQVLFNLLMNAAQAMNHQGLVSVEVEVGTDYDRIFIADTGPGVDMALKEKIFEPLFTQKAQGTGLGLSICRQIVEQHGGTLELLDTSSPGATFLLCLPQAHVETTVEATRHG